MPRVSYAYKWLIAAAAFAACVGPTFISYHPYVFRWDDAGYLSNAILVSRTFWSGTTHGITHLREIASALHDIRPPAMKLLGLPWGSLTSWDAAGKCFLTLAVLVSFLVSFCLLLMARIGVKPCFLLLASICVFAALGPLPADSGTNHLATGLMADSLFAWIALAALLLIPYEARSQNLSTRQALLHGALWGFILSSGAMTKMDFLYFVALIVPTLLVIRLRQGGRHSALFALAGLVCGSALATAFLVKYGRLAFANGAASSFGAVAGYYDVSFPHFLAENLHQSPGLAFFFAFVIAALAYLIVQRRSFLLEPEFLAILFVAVFGVIVLASENRQIRYSFPVIVALPFLLAVGLSGEKISIPQKPALLASGLVFCVLTLAALPTLSRAQREASLGRSDAVLVQAIKCNDRQILLATDSPTLNVSLLQLAALVTPSASTMQIDTLANSAMDQAPINQDFQRMQSSDQVIFQKDGALSPPFTNLRVPDYRRYIEQQSGYAPFKVGGDIVAYSKGCESW